MEPQDQTPPEATEAAEATEPAVVNHVIEHRTFAREDADTPMPVTTTGA